MDDQLLTSSLDGAAVDVEPADEASGRTPPRRRADWIDDRRRMEATRDWFTADGRKRRPPVEPVDLAVKPFAALLRVTGIARWVFRSSLTIDRTEIEIALPGLAGALDGYHILHITDPHLDALPGLADALVEACRGVCADLVVLTGDFRGREVGPFQEHHLIADLGRALDVVEAPDGAFATLGNHDCAAMAAPLEALGLRVLMDEEVTLRLRGVEVSIVGLDDPHRFHGPASVRCLERLPPAPDRFRLFLVHSPELATRAAARDGDLYLCGHTHGGQICLPGGRPLVTHLHCEKDLGAGLWRRGGMVGYTSPGAGVSQSLPLRLFSRSEITLFTLRAGTPTAAPAPHPRR